MSDELNVAAVAAPPSPLFAVAEREEVPYPAIVVMIPVPQSMRRTRLPVSPTNTLLIVSPHTPAGLEKLADVAAMLSLGALL